MTEKYVYIKACSFSNKILRKMCDKEVVEDVKPEFIKLFGNEDLDYITFLYTDKSLKFEHSRFDFYSDEYRWNNDPLMPLDEFGDCKWRERNKYTVLGWCKCKPSKLLKFNDWILVEQMNILFSDVFTQIRLMLLLEFVYAAHRLNFGVVKVRSSAEAAFYYELKVFDEGVNGYIQNCLTVDNDQSFDMLLLRDYDSYQREVFDVLYEKGYDARPCSALNKYNMIITWNWIKNVPAKQCCRELLILR